MRASDEVLAIWCHRMWQTHPRAQSRGIDATQPQDHMGEAAEGLREVLYELSQRRRRTELDVAAERSGSAVQHAVVERAIEHVEAYASRVEEARLAALVVDCWVSMDFTPGLQCPTSRAGRCNTPGKRRVWPGKEHEVFLPGPLAREDARQRGELKRAGWAEFTAAQLRENPVLAGILERYGADGVYAFAELTQHEVEVIWLEHRRLPETVIAEMTQRPPALVRALLAKARWRLAQVGSGSAAMSTMAVAG